MKKIILCFVIFVLGTFAFAFTSSPFREPAPEWKMEQLNIAAQELLNTTKYTKKQLEDLDLISFHGHSNLAYDICDRVKSFTTDEEILKFVKVYQSVALTRMLVENGVIESIHQLPVESMGIFNHQAKLITHYKIDLPKDEKQKIEESIYNVLTDNPKNQEEQEITKEALEKEGITLENYKEYIEEIVSEATRSFRNVLPEEYANEKYTTYEQADFTAKEISREHWTILDIIATIALVEKYPLAAEKIFNDYFNKYGTRGLTSTIINYFVNIKDFDTAIRLCETALEIFENIEPDNTDSFANRVSMSEKFYSLEKYSGLMAACYAKAGNIDKAVEIINKLIDDLENDKENKKSYLSRSIPNQKIEYLINKILFYKYAGVEDKYKKEIDQIKNEIVIISSSEEENTRKYDLENLNYNIDLRDCMYSTIALNYTYYSKDSAEENVEITLTYMDHTIIM